MARFDNADDLRIPGIDHELIQEMAETNEEFAELVQQLGDCRDAEIKWASTVADDMTRLSDLRSLRRDLELEIRGLVGTEEPVEPSKGS